MNDREPTDWYDYSDSTRAYVQMVTGSGAMLAAYFRALAEMLDSVSKYHVMIYRKGRKVEIEDLNSLNGTFVNGTRVRISPLQSGDRIRIANVDLVYQR